MLNTLSSLNITMGTQITVMIDRQIEDELDRLANETSTSKNMLAKHFIKNGIRAAASGNMVADTVIE